MSQLCERIKKVRKDNNLSQVAFARVLNVHRGHISKIETGAANASEPLLLTICLEFNIGWTWLNDGKGPMKEHWGPKELKEIAKFALIQPKQKTIFLIFEVILGVLDSYTKITKCLGDDVFRLLDGAVNPGDLEVIEAVENILDKLKFKALKNKKPGSAKLLHNMFSDELTEIEKAVINILRGIDSNLLKDFYLFLASKGERLDRNEKEKLKRYIVILKKASY